MQLTKPKPRITQCALTRKFQHSVHRHQILNIIENSINKF